ncbi:hypothetical protein J2S76_002075 [Ancylobacter vacuolatus]|uniref:Uncharacterized protein n=1 Tax=Ancylobacter vacuolatus TaxID=223389 RepID=A0ABU0DH50_9HYPH|nr:hypothetical protein [Ancylobacter vacuolatus]
MDPRAKPGDDGVLPDRPAAAQQDVLKGRVAYASTFSSARISRTRGITLVP